MLIHFRSSSMPRDMITQARLRKITRFNALSPKTLLTISEYGFESKYQQGQTLVIEGEAAQYGYFILSGEVRVLRMHRNGRIQILARFGPGAPLNIISLLNSKGVNTASIEALTPVDVLVFDSVSFTKLLATCPDFSVMMLKIFSERITHLTELAANLSLYSVRTRLARFLIEIADSPQASGGWTQDEIAAHIGTVRDVVGRLLRELESSNIILRDRQKIRLIDRQALIKQAEQEDV